MKNIFIALLLGITTSVYPIADTNSRIRTLTVHRTITHGIPVAMPKTPSPVTPSTSSGISLKTVLIASGVVIGAVILGKLAYNYFFALTDIQEIEKALKECDYAHTLHNDITQTYRLHNSDVSDLDRDEVYDIVTAHYSYRPYYYFVLKLDRDMARVTSYKESLVGIKIRLYELRSNLTSKLTQHNAEEINELRNGYAKTIARIETVHDELQLAHRDLHTIHAKILRMPEYDREYKEVRIEQLEQENARLHAQNTAYVYAQVYSTPRPKPTTQIHVYQQQPQQPTTSTETITITESETHSTTPSAGAHEQPAVVYTQETQAAHIPRSETTSANLSEVVATQASVSAPSPSTTHEQTTRVQEYENFRNEVMFLP